MCVHGSITYWDSRTLPQHLKKPSLFPAPSRCAIEADPFGRGEDGRHGRRGAVTGAPAESGRPRWKSSKRSSCAKKRPRGLAAPAGGASVHVGSSVHKLDAADPASLGGASARATARATARAASRRARRGARRRRAGSATRRQAPRRRLGRRRRRARRRQPEGGGLARRRRVRRRGRRRGRRHPRRRRRRGRRRRPPQLPRRRRAAAVTVVVNVTNGVAVPRSDLVLAAERRGRLARKRGGCAAVGRGAEACRLGDARRLARGPRIIQRHRRRRPRCKRVAGERLGLVLPDIEVGPIWVVRHKGPQLRAESPAFGDRVVPARRRRPMHAAALRNLCVPVHDPLRVGEEVVQVVLVAAAHRRRRLGLARSRLHFADLLDPEQFGRAQRGGRRHSKVGGARSQLSELLLRFTAPPRPHVGATTRRADATAAAFCPPHGVRTSPR